MKTIYRLCFIITGFAISSCQWGVAPAKKSDVYTDTLNYTYKTVNQRAADCGNKPDSGCTVVKVHYPVFSSPTTLNDSVTRKLTSLFAMDGKPDSSVNAMAANFIKGYESFKKQDSKSSIFYTLNSYARVQMQDTGIITLQIGGYSFQGGAHGSSPVFFINWDTKSNKNIGLDDIFAAGYPNKLKMIADTIFRKEEKLSDTSSLARDYFFKDNKFALNNNFIITPLGLKFMYNQYEIKPYAAGTTELFIPYSQIKSILRPNTVVAKYFK